MRRNAYLLRGVGAVVLFSALQAGAQTSSSLRPKHPYMTPAQIRKGLPETLPPERFSYNRYIESGYRVAKRLPKAVASSPASAPARRPITEVFSIASQGSMQRVATSANVKSTSLLRRPRKV